MRIRFLGLAAGLAVGFLAVAATASACFQPTLSIGGSYGPGDPVPYTVTGTEAGATYTLSRGHYGGQVLDSGVDPDGQGHSASFTMPDLGSEPAQLTVHLQAVHSEQGSGHDGSGAEFTDVRQVSYAPPAPPPAQPGDGPVEADTPATPAQQGSAQHGPSEPAEQGQPAADAPQPPASPPTPVAGSGVEATRPAGAGANAAQGREAGAALGARAARAAADSAARERAATVPLNVPKATPAPGSAAWVAGIVLLAVAGVAGVHLLRRRDEGEGDLAPAVAPWLPPSFDQLARHQSDLIEAELQEIIAEERARALLAPPPATGAAQPPRSSTERTPASSTA